MALSFQALLLSSSDGVHLYHVTLDENRVLHLVLNEGSQEILATDSEGRVSGSAKMLLGSGDVETTSAETVDLEDFTLISAHIRTQWLKTGTAPKNIRKFFG